MKNILLILLLFGSLQSIAQVKHHKTVRHKATRHKTVKQTGYKGFSSGISKVNGISTAGVVVTTANYSTYANITVAVPSIKSKGDSLKIAYLLIKALTDSLTSAKARIYHIEHDSLITDFYGKGTPTDHLRVTQ